MDNGYSHRPRKRVTKKIAQRRRLVALVLIVLLLILGVLLIVNACSDKKDDDGGDTKPGTSQSATTTAPGATTPAVTTTAVVTTTRTTETGDPNDPNTITKIDLSMYEVFINVGESKMPIVTMSPTTAPSSYKEEIWESTDPAVATVDWLGNITGVSAGSCYVTVTSKNNPQVYAEVKVTVSSPDGQLGGAVAGGASAVVTTSGSGDATQTTTVTAGNAASVQGIEVKDGITYVNGILVANKSYSLPADYAPGLNSEAKAQFDKLAADAAKEGLNIYLSSGYRSYSYQKQIYSNYSGIYGAAKADTFSARPGHSEHQTGLAIDVNSIDDSFTGTPEAIWLADHAHEYGFIIRYPKDKVEITGYKYEPWHLRYLGVSTATDVFNSGLCLEEYLGIDSKYSS